MFVWDSDELYKAEKITQKFYFPTNLISNNKIKNIIFLIINNIN
jgi:hypothetical protein